MAAPIACSTEAAVAATEDLPIVYDLGMNNGDDSAYYLAKGFRVIGVDANPSMCALCSERFRSAISAGRMTVLNVGVSDEAGRQVFSINTEKHAISTFTPENFSEDWVPQSWEQVPVRVERASAIIAEYGLPHFIKVDVEFYDRNVLRDLCEAAVKPPFISTEAHHAECLELLVAMGYERFRLVAGESVSRRFANVEILRRDGTLTPFSFNHDSSGPFGEDLETPWTNLREVRRELDAHGLGWIDIHATI
jgi:FkbM family methyltransferase